MDFEKCSMYSLGIVILAFLTNQSGNLFYDFANLKIKWEMIDLLVKRCTKNYSKDLIDVLNKMID
jgi:hypothetical protein